MLYKSSSAASGIVIAPFGWRIIRAMQPSVARGKDCRERGKGIASRPTAGVIHKSPKRKSRTAVAGNGSRSQRPARWRLFAAVNSPWLGSLVVVTLWGQAGVVTSSVGIGID